MDHAGGCHCGNIHVALRLSKPPEQNLVRTCTCSFCRSHDPRMISDPAGLLEISAEDWSLVELYRFGMRTADFVICRRCGVFIAVISDLESAPCAVVNVNCLDDRPVSRHRRQCISRCFSLVISSNVAILTFEIEYRLTTS